MVVVRKCYSALKVCALESVLIEVDEPRESHIQKDVSQKGRNKYLPSKYIDLERLY